MAGHSPSRHRPQAPAPARDNAPGLPARRLAASVIDEVLRARTALDETFERLLPDAGLDAADAGLARAIAITAFRRLGTIQQAIDERLDRGSPRQSGPFEPILTAAAAQILFLDVPDHAAVDLAIRHLHEDPRSSRYAALGNAVLRRLVRERDAVLAESRAGPRFAAALGDPSLSVGLSFRAGDARLSLDARYSEPLGVAEPYEAAARGIASGGGERGLELSGGAVLFADPLALSLRLAAALASPPSWPPAPGLRGLALSLGATEALNAEFAYSLALVQRLAFPLPGAGPVAAERSLPGYSASLSFAVLRSGARGQLRVSVAKELSAASAPSIGFSFAYRVPLSGREAGP